MWHEGKTTCNLFFANMAPEKSRIARNYSETSGRHCLKSCMIETQVLVTRSADLILTVEKLDLGQKL